MKPIKMISAFLLAATVLVTASCSSGSKTPEPAASQEAGSSAAAESSAPAESKPIDRLSFINDGEIYIELKLDSSVKNASASLDGTALSGNKTAYKKGAKFTLNGDFTEGAGVNIIVFISKSTDGSIEDSVEFKKGVDVEMVSEIVTKCLDRENVRKVFVSIFEKDGTWDQSLSEEMNDFIVQMYPALK